LSQDVHLKKAMNGYVASYSDGLAEMVHVFTDFPDLVDWLMRHFDESAERKGGTEPQPEPKEASV
jgi:hypothetical protein